MSKKLQKASTLRHLAIKLALAAFVLIAPAVSWGQQTLPYSYGFEDNNLSSDGWTAQISSSSSGINTAAAHSGSYGFRFQYSENPGYLVSPLLTGGTNGVEVSFWYAEYSSQYGNENFQVGYTTDANETDPSNFTYGAIIEASTSWQQHTETLPAGTVRIAIKYLYVDAFYLWLDDFTFEAHSSCAKPTNLEVTNDGQTATVTWDGTATNNFIVTVNGTPTSGVTSPYTFNVDVNTTYVVSVVADCGTDGTSNPVTTSFTTPFCTAADMCELTFELTDFYGDGWNGAAIKVVDVTTGIIIGQVTNVSEDGNSGCSGGDCAETVIRTMPVCNGREIQFLWVNGNYDSECSYVVKDINDEEIFSGSNAMSEPVNYTTNCTPTACPAPRNLQYVAEAHNATLTWTGNAASYDVRYVGVGSTTTESLHYDNETCGGSLSFGTMSSDSYSSKWAVMFPAGSYTSIYLNSVSVYNVEATTATLYIYNDGASAPDNLIATKEITMTAAQAYVDYSFDQPLVIDPTKNLWVVLYSNGNSPVAFCEGPTNDNGRWVTWDGSSWMTFGERTWKIRANMSAGTSVTTNTTSQTLTGLTPETGYIVQVRANCGDAGYSDWATISFTTDEACHAPTNLQAVAGRREAELTWNGDAASYEVRCGQDNPQIHYDNGSYSTSMGNGSNPFYWAAMFPAGSYTGEMLKSVTLLAVANTTITAYIYNDGATAPSNLVGSMDIAMTQTATFVEYPFAQPLAIDNTKNLWVVFHTETGYPAATAAEGTDANGRWLSVDGTNWQQASYNWIIRATTISFGTPVTANTTSHTITDLTPETDYIAQVRANCGDDGYSNWSTVNFTTDIANPAPTSLAVNNITAYTADISWTADEEATGAVLEYAAAVGVPFTEYHYDNGTLAGSVGLGGGAFQWGVMFPAGSYAGNIVSKVSVYDPTAMTGTVTIYNDGTSAPENAVVTVPVTFTGVGDFIDIEINAIIDDTKNVWVIFNNESGANYPAAGSTDNLDDPNGRWVEINGTWYDLPNAGVSNRAFLIHAVIGSLDVSSMTWTTVDNVTSPYQLTELTPETNYMVRVKSLFEGYGESEWSSTYFITDVACHAPTNLTATPTNNSASIAWEGTAGNYNVRYRTSEYSEALFFDDFENGLDQWTIYSLESTAGGLTDGWTSRPSSSEAPVPHSGDYSAVAYSYTSSDGSMEADNYLVSPLVPLGGTLKFWVNTVGSYPDNYEVLLSTTGNAVADFTVTLQDMATPPTNSSWNEVVIDLSSYTGNGYIAIHHANYDGYFLAIDDFGIYGDPFPAGEWQNTSTNSNSLEIPGLIPRTSYDIEVQADCGSEDGTSQWTSASFTTLPITMDIEAKKWYGFSSPINTPSVNNITNLVTTGTNFAYDLYYYNEPTATWMNYKNHTENFEFQNGRGYIYRRSADATLTFNGTPNSGDIEIGLDYTATLGDNKGFNLVGNPYLHEFTIGQNCYSLSSTGSWTAHVGSYTLGIAEAVILHASNTGLFTFTEGNNNSKAGYNTSSVLAFTVMGNDYEDVTYARFENGEGLPKIGHIASEAPALSIPIEGRRYAIANLGYDCQSFDMNLSAPEGEYTIILNSKLSSADFSYIHLIDRATGRDIDMLSNGSYTFNMSGSQAISNRFMVKLTPNMEETSISNFAYWNGSNLVINGTGTLEAFDVLGRTIFSKELSTSGSQISTLNFPATGVYILRLNGQSQKIIVK